MRNNVKMLLNVVVVEFEISNNNKKKNRAAAAISDAREWLNAGLAGPSLPSQFAKLPSESGLAGFWYLYIFLQIPFQFFFL